MDTPTLVVSLVALAVSIFAGISAAAARHASQERRLARIECKVDRILAHLDIAETSAIPEDIRTELVRGNTITAIKLYREAHGVGLKEAKGAIEEMMAQV
ncbi:MAG: hypothetical protein ACRDHP_20570 [Ktedonobacterales bacterium]